MTEEEYKELKKKLYLARLDQKKRLYEQAKRASKLKGNNQ